MTADREREVDAEREWAAEEEDGATPAWVVVKFDEQLVQWAEGGAGSQLWRTLAQVCSNSEGSGSSEVPRQGEAGTDAGVDAGAGTRCLLVCPPLQRDLLALEKMIRVASEGGTWKSVLGSVDQAVVPACVRGAGAEDEDESHMSLFELWMRRVMRMARAATGDGEVGCMADMLETVFMSVHNQLTGILLLREASARTRARIMAAASEIVAHVMVAHLNVAQASAEGAEMAYFMDSRDFLFSVTDFVRFDQQPHWQNQGHHPEQRQWSVKGGSTGLLSSSGLERELEKKHVEHYLKAYCDTPFRDAELIQFLKNIKSRIVVTQGNVARDSTSGDTTILGRGGSDSTVAYLAAKLGAQRVDIWTHTYGLFTCQMDEPSGELLPTARILKRISYDEALEIAANNSTILDPTCIKVLQDSKIPMRVRSMKLQDRSDGTLITFLDPMHANAGISSLNVKCICLRTNITLISVECLDMWQSVGFLADVFTVFKRHDISISHVATSETNVTCTLDTSSEDLDVHTTNSLIRGLQELNCQVDRKEKCVGVSLVGHGIRAVLHRLGPAMKFFEEHQIHLLSQASSDLNLTFIVDEAQSVDLVQKLHAWLFGSSVPNNVIGREWENIVYGEKADFINHVNNSSLWWHKKRDQLLKLAAEETPLYVYDEDTLVENAKSLLCLVTEDMILDTVYFAMKANPNRHILQIFEALGLGFECVSLGEVDRVLSLFPSIDRKRILFTPNFSPREDYERGFELGINVTLDNTYPLIHWEEVFRDREIFCRIDPGHGLGHHRKVKTAGTNSKFGIPSAELDDLAIRCERAQCRVVGLHSHVGSGILTQTNSWRDTAQFLGQVMQKFPHVKTLDLGGGLGVPQKPGDVLLDIRSVSDSLRSFKEDHPDVRLIMEPGRYLVATAGVLLSRVTQTKSKGHKVYVGIDTGMNSMMRPPLYGSYHEIVNLTRMHEPYEIMADICGPICESGDMLGQDRPLQNCVHGDVILLATAGAYGYSMSNDYNLRKRGKEIMLPSTSCE